MAANEIKITFTFDEGAFMREYLRRLALGSATDADRILQEMANDVQQFITIGEPKDILDADIIDWQITARVLV